MSKLDPARALSAVKFPLRYLFLEGLLITLGVFLAFQASEFRDGRQRSRLAQEALHSIQLELEQNAELVKGSNQYHSERAEKIMSAEGVTLRDFPRGFIAPADILQTAWDTARETGALGGMPYEDVLKIARMYEQQKKYKMVVQRSGDLIYRSMYEKGAQGVLDDLQGVGNLLRSMQWSEAALIDSYEAALEELLEISA